MVLVTKKTKCRGKVVQRRGDRQGPDGADEKARASEGAGERAGERHGRERRGGS